MKPKRLKQLQVRGKNLHAHFITPQLVAVSSRSSPAANHIVTLEYGADGRIQARCTCPWALNGGVACSHVIAALEQIATRRGRRLSFWSTLDEARRQKHRLFYLTGGRNDEEGVWITSRAA